MEYIRAKWIHYGSHMVNAKGEHNSQLKIFITQFLLVVPCSSSYPSFNVIVTIPTLPTTIMNSMASTDDVVWVLVRLTLKLLIHMNDNDRK